MLEKRKEVKLDIDYIESVLQIILNKAHEDSEKKKIKRYPNRENPERFNMACPICGDSHKDNRKKRFWVFMSNMYCVCYNNRESDSMSFTKLCKRFNVEIDPEKRLQLYDYLDKNWTYSKKDDFTINNIDKLIDIKDFMEYFSKNNKFLYNISPIIKDSLQYNYLVKRKIYNHENILQAIYKITDTWRENVIIILNRFGDKIISFQIRNLKEKKEQRIYKFYQFEQIHEMLYPDKHLDEIEAISYNKLSAIFNILNVDFERDVYVFEGYLDSIFFPNSIALVGLDTDISFLGDENLSLKFVFDNDESGMIKSKKMINDNKRVFLWKKLLSKLSKNNNRLEFFLKNNIKDINKLAEYVDVPDVYRTLNLDSYFSIDKLDLIDM